MPITTVPMGQGNQGIKENPIQILWIRDPDPSNRATTWDPELIARLMRVITAIGVCDEVGQERYASNPVTGVFAKGGIEAGVKFLYV